MEKLVVEHAPVTIPPGLAHRFEARQHLVVVEYYAGIHDPDDDIPFQNFD